MNPVLFVMAILGCADAGDQCQTVQVVPVQYVSAAACNAAAEPTLGRYSGLTYPVVAASCQKVDRPVVAEAGIAPAG